MPTPLPRLLPTLLIALAWGPALAEAPAPARQAELETLLYQDCGSCHGMTLRGGLGPALTRSRMRAYDREALAALILHGIPGTAMPGWAPLLSDADARWLADHLQHAAPQTP
ncbi:c-type cytochrome [Halomonas nitroreducens]|uniref:Cytochrome c n=1 Tax=Halomonas nitroreducens TaxID=447425 RepID=A0A3S0HQI5_9GAMM|nr:cytochrome c [Halomonas nitroreducens]RTR04480.1 cytochrome c [Halomonas nitroreducens]